MVALSAVPAWQFRHWQWIALALAAPVVGWAVRRRPPGPVGALAVAGPVAALGWSGYLLLVGGAAAQGVTWSLTSGPPLAAAAGLAAITLVPRAGDEAAERALTVAVVATAVAALGFWLGRGSGPAAVATAAAVLIAGSPTALLLASPRGRRVDAVVVPEELLTTGELEVLAVHPHGAAAEIEVRRFAAALHAAAVPSATGPADAAHADGAPSGARSADAQPSDGERPAAGPSARATSARACEAPRARATRRARAHEFLAPRWAGGLRDDGDASERVPTPAAAPSSAGSGPLGRAVVAAATGPLPGVSDLDGRPDTGLRGIVSERHGDRVVAHAVLVGPPAWLAEHGVAAPAGIGPGAPAVAWDGVARGWLEITETARPGATAAITALRRRGVEAVPAGPDPVGTVSRLRAAGRTAAAAVGGEATVPPCGGGRAASLPFPDLAAVARAVRQQHRRVLLRRVCLVVAQAAAVGGAAAALLGLLNPAAAIAVPVVSAVLVVASTRRRRHPFGATA